MEEFVPSAALMLTQMDIFAAKQKKKDLLRVVWVAMKPHKLKLKMELVMVSNLIVKVDVATMKNM